MYSYICTYVVLREPVSKIVPSTESVTASPPNPCIEAVTSNIIQDSLEQPFTVDCGIRGTGESTQQPVVNTSAETDGVIVKRTDLKEQPGVFDPPSTLDSLIDKSTIEKPQEAVEQEESEDSSSLMNLMIVDEPENVEVDEPDVKLRTTHTVGVPQHFEEIPPRESIDGHDVERDSSIDLKSNKQVTQGTMHVHVH